MEKNKKIKRIVVTFVATFILITCLVVPVSAHTLYSWGSYPYATYGCFGELVNSSPVELNIMHTFCVTSANNPSGSGKYCFSVFTEKFRDTYLNDFLSTNPNGNAFQFWDFCLSSDLLFNASSGRSLTFGDYINAYPQYRDYIRSDFYEFFKADSNNNLAYNTGFTDGLDVGYTNALNDTNSFKEGLLSIFNAPIYVLNQVFNFELFGINLYYIITAILTISIVAFVIKLVL